MSKKLRFGIMSTARIARNSMIPGILKSERCEVGAVASRNAEKASELAERYHIGKYYGSYDELLEDPDIDAVYIPLPNHLHKPWTIKAAQAGKHILCEKPAALTEADVREMAEAAKAHNVFLRKPLCTDIIRNTRVYAKSSKAAKSGSFAGFTDRSPSTMRRIKAMSVTARIWAEAQSMTWDAIPSRQRE